MTHRRIVVDRFGGPEVLRLDIGAVPRPAPGEVLVRVEAAGVAYADLLMRAGRYPGGPRPPFVPGWDATGVVEALGADVPVGWSGERVAALLLTGGYASHVRVPVGALAVVPPGVDLAAAACLPVNYVAAHQMLHDVARVRPGERLLVHGAAGGVGTALLDLARRLDVEVIGTASGHRTDIVESYGAHAVDRSRTDHGVRLRALIADGVDAVFDGAGGPATAAAFRALRPGGRLVSYGFTAVATGRSALPAVVRQLAGLRIRSLLPNGRRAGFYRLSAVARRTPDRVRADLGMLLGALAAGELRPLVGARVPLAEAGRAHELLAGSSAGGKTLLLP